MWLAQHDCTPLLDKCLDDRGSLLPRITYFGIVQIGRPSHLVRLIISSKWRRKVPHFMKNLAPNLQESSSSLRKKEYLAYTPQANRANNTDRPHNERLLPSILQNRSSSRLMSSLHPPIQNANLSLELKSTTCNEKLPPIFSPT